MVSGNWIDIYQIPMILGDSVEHEYTLFEITDFLDTFNRYLEDTDISAFAGFLTVGAVTTIIINVVIILVTISNSNAKKAASLAIVVSIILAIVYLGTISNINSEMEEATYGGIEELLRATSNPYWLIAFSVLTFIGTKKIVPTKNVVITGQTVAKIKCNQCGAEIDELSSFCNNCGTAVVTEQKTEDEEIYCMQCGMSDIRIIRIGICKSVQCFYESVNVHCISVIGCIVRWIQIMNLTFAVFFSESVREQRANMSLNLQQVFEKQLAQIFIQFIQSNNIFKASTLKIILCCLVFERLLISAD